MRASVIHGNLAAVERLGPEASGEIRDGVEPRVLEAIEQANKSAWLPLEHDVELSRNVQRVIGPQRRVDWARASMLLALRTSLLEPLWKAAFRVFGVSPGALFRAVPPGWKAVYRNVGGAEHQSKPSAAVLVFSGVPDVLLDNEDYLRGMCGTFSALLDIAEASGTVEILNIDSRARLVEYEARWGPALE